MQISYNQTSSFPDQVVPDAEKATMEYGLAVGRAIEGEWFRGYRYGTNAPGYATNFNNYNLLRLYARGEQPVQKYKDELAINGDLSYLNLDWKPVPVVSKFVDIVVNGMSQRSYDINAYAQDPVCSKIRTDYARNLMVDIEAKEYLEQAQKMLGVDAFSQDPINAPRDKEELEVHLQMDFKQSVEVAEEEVINQILDKNRYDLVRQRFNYDLTVLGIGSVKTSWNRSQGVVVDYVDPAHLVYSYSDDPNFEDLYYVGEVKSVYLADIKKQFPQLTDEELETIQKYPGNQEYLRNWNGKQDDQTIQVLYFEYKSYSDQVYKIKYTDAGLEKALEKPDTFAPPPNDGFERVSRTIETLYSGAKILGHPMMLDWRMAEHMTRPVADTTKVNFSYAITAPRMYKGRIESLVDLGNGTNYNPAEALNMYFQTGSVVGRSMTQEGGMNPGKVPIQELQTGSGGGKINSLIQTYQYYLQLIRDVTGLNEARDGSNPDKNSLVGLQKLAAANSNTATRHILQSSLYLTARACENISLRVADSLQFPFTKEALKNSISSFNTGTLTELMNLQIHDFGIFIKLEPDEEEKAELEKNIQIALKSGQIDLADAIDIREVRNLKLANQMLKFRRKKKAEADQAAAQANIQAQAQANQQTAEKAILAEMQKQQALTESTVQIEQAKSQFEIQRMQNEAQMKAQLDMKALEIRHQFDTQLKQMDVSRVKEREQFIEDRKDNRTKLQATQQSSMIQQRQQELLPTDFETQSNPQSLGADNMPM